MRRPLLLLLLFALAACGTPPAGTEQVVSITDGDTFRTPTGPIRLLGVQAPETYGTDECYGQEAAAKTRDLLTGTEVLLVPDPGEPDTDKYDRRLRYVTTDTGEDLSAYLVRYGYARVYREYQVQRTPFYLELEQEARMQQRGGWRDCGW